MVPSYASLVLNRPALLQIKMATASGFSLAGSGSGLFGSTAKTTASNFPAFGSLTNTVQPSASSFSFGLPKTTQATASGVAFGATTLGQPAATGILGGTLGFGNKPSASVSAFSVAKTSQVTQPLGFAASTTSGFGLGQNLLGAKSSVSSVAPFQLTATTTANLSLFGAAASLPNIVTSASAANQPKK